MSKKNDKKPDIRSFFAATKKKIRYDNVSSSKLTPSSSSSEKIRKSKEKQPKQVTIESLGRVVVIEEFERCKGKFTGYVENFRLGSICFIMVFYFGEIGTYDFFLIWTII